MSSIALSTIFHGYLLPLILRINHAIRTRQPSPKVCGPPFRSPHTFPTEIVLHVAEFLDEASLLALRHTNRDLFYIISLTPDQNSGLCEAYNLTALGRLNDQYYKDRVGFCTGCQKPRPLKSFSASEVLALDRQQQANCLRHTQIWICPHMSYSYQSIMEPTEIGFLPSWYWHEHPDCGGDECRLVFRHNIVEGSRMRHYYIISHILVAMISHRGGRDMIRNTTPSLCSKAQIRKALNSIRAPICDHHLLSDAKVCDSYDPTDIDVYEHYQGAVLPPREHERAARRSDGSCSFCRTLGVQTTFRFKVTTFESSYQAGTLNFSIDVVSTRSLTAYMWKLSALPDKHWRAHGATERRLAKFREAWTSNELPNGRPRCLCVRNGL